MSTPPASNSKKHHRSKPKKPHSGFPLTPHANGQWCKKIRGKLHYFGTWEDPEGALQEYLHAAKDLHAGRKPRVTLLEGQLTVKDLCNHYLTFQSQRLGAGEIAIQWFAAMKANLTAFAHRVGKQRPIDDLRPDDFQDFREYVRKNGTSPKHPGGLGPDGLTRTVTIIRGMFKYAYEMELIDRPMKYGRSFDRPSATQRRKARRAAEMNHGKRLFSPEQIQDLLALAGCPLKAMIYLGLNAGFGNTDCARLLLSVLDMERGVIEFDRPKTGVERVAPLWPETIKALRQALEARPTPREEARNLVFVTIFGRSWSREIMQRDSDGLIKTVSRSDSIGQEFDKVLRKLGIKRPGLSFYALRHTFRTFADEAGDQHAVHRIMGHQIPGMSGIYVEDISLDRLRAVTDHVRKKIF